MVWIHLQSLQVGSFPRHHLPEQLFLQTNRGHCEVDEGGLGLKLRQEMGIGQLCVDDEPEVAVVFTLLSPELNAPVAGGGLKVNNQKLLYSSTGDGCLIPEDRRK